MTITYPWAGESGQARPCPIVTLDQLLFAWACVQHRLQLAWNAERRAAQQ